VRYDKEAAEVVAQLEKMRLQDISQVLCEQIQKKLYELLQTMNYELAEIEFYEDWEQEDFYCQRVDRGTTKTIYAYLPKCVYNGDVLENFAAAVRFVADNHGVTENFEAPTADTLDAFCVWDD